MDPLSWIGSDDDDKDVVTWRTAAACAAASVCLGCASAQLVYRLLRTRDGGTRVDLFLASARPQFACLLSCFWFWASLRVVVERASDRLDGVVEAGVLCAIALVAYSILLEVEAAANRRAHEFIRHEKCHPNFLQKMKLVDSVSRSGNPIQDFEWNTAGTAHHGVTRVLHESLTVPLIGVAKRALVATACLVVMGFNVSAYVVMFSFAIWSALSSMFFAFGTFSQIASIALLGSNEIFDIGEIVSVGRDLGLDLTNAATGIVERISSSYITLRRFDMKQLFVPTRDLATSHVVNWSRRPRKEIRATVTLAHDTHPEAAARLLHGVKRRVCVDPGLDHAQYSKVEFTSLQAGCDESESESESP